MSAILNCVSKGKATFYRKIFVDIDQAEKGIASLIKRYNVGLGSATNDKKFACNGHLVIQYNQNLRQKRQVIICILITLPQEIRDISLLYQKLVADLQVEPAPTPRKRKNLAISYQKAFIKKDFKERDGSENREEFHSLEHEKQRIYIYNADSVVKLELKKSDYPKAKVQQMQKYADEQALKHGKQPRKISGSRWTWHLTPIYMDLIFSVAKVEIDQKILIKKDLIKKTVTQSKANMPTKDVIKRQARLEPSEYREAISNVAFMVDTIPMFGGTLADVGQVVQKLEKQFNRGQAHKAKGAWATQKKVHLPITEAFDIQRLKKEASYSTRIDWKYHSFSSLYEAVETFADHEDMDEKYKQKREEDVLKFYEKGQARIARRTKQQNNDRRIKLSRERVQKLIQKRFSKWKDKVRGIHKDQKQ